MNIFNAALSVISVTPVDDVTWDIIANMTDNTGVFYPWDAQITDIVYNFALSNVSGISSVCRYVVTYIDPLTDFNSLYARITWGEDDITDVCVPQSYSETIIGRLISPNFPCSYVTSQNNGVSEGFVSMARDIDIAYGVIHRTADIQGVERTEKFVVVDNNVKEYVLSHVDILSVDSVFMNGLELSNDPDDDYIINNNKIQFNTGVNLTLTDIVMAKYKSRS